MEARAFFIHDFGEASEPEAGWISLPDPGPGEVRVEIAYSGVNPVDVRTRAGQTIQRADARFPMVLGWEASGTVAAAGDDAEHLVGRRVALMTPQVVDQRGTHASAIVVSASKVAPVPDAVDDRYAAAVPLAGLTAAQGLSLLDLGPGCTVAINGAAGAIGRFAVQLAGRTGAAVVAVAGAADRPLLSALGAAASVDRAGDVPTDVRWAAGGPVDAAFDLVGGASADLLLAAVRDGGRFVSAVPASVDPASPVRAPRGITLRPVYVRARADDLGDVLDLVAADELEVRIAGVVALEAAADALERVTKGGLRGKLLLDPR